MMTCISDSRHSSGFWLVHLVADVKLLIYIRGCFGFSTTAQKRVLIYRTGLTVSTLSSLSLHVFFIRKKYNTGFLRRKKVHKVICIQNSNYLVMECSFGFS